MVRWLRLDVEVTMSHVLFELSDTTRRVFSYYVTERHLFLNNRDTAGQERFRTITTAYYRGAMVSTYSYYFTDLCYFVCLQYIFYC